MSRGKNKTVTLGPKRMGRVKIQKFIKKQVSDRSHGHWSSGMTAFGSLDRIHYQGPNRINRKVFNGKSHGIPFSKNGDSKLKNDFLYFTRFFR